MKKDKMNEIEQNRKNFSIKSMYFNRYLIVRYTTALFFFTNLYWFISLVMTGSLLSVIPFALMVVLLLSVAEQVRIYSHHTNNAKYTKISYVTLLSTNILLAVPTLFSSSFSYLYPFLITQGESKLMVLIILIIGILLSGLMLKRLNLIRHNQDRHYFHLESFEKAVNE